MQTDYIVPDITKMSKSEKHLHTRRWKYRNPPILVLKPQAPKSYSLLSKVQDSNPFSYHIQGENFCLISIVFILVTILPHVSPWTVFADGDLDALGRKTLADCRALNHTREFFGTKNRELITEDRGKYWARAMADLLRIFLIHYVDEIEFETRSHIRAEGYRLKKPTEGWR